MTEVRTWDDLTTDEQQKAEAACLADLLTAVVDGAVRFNDEANRDTLQAAIDAAGQKAEEVRTPWFVGEIIMEASYKNMDSDDASVGEALRGMARCDAEDAIYPTDEQRVVRL